MSRLIAVELRKLVNTRAGLWLVLAIGLVSLLIMTAMLIWADDSDLVFGNIFGLMNIPTGFLLPVLAILLVTSEWGQRTGLVTFTLEPRRSRVVVAKLATALVAAVGAMLTALAFGALGTVLAGVIHGAPAGDWHMTLAGLSNSVMLQLMALLMGFAFGMLIRNSAAAIVLYFVIPTIWSILAQVIPWVHDHLQMWADFSFAQQPFQSGEWASGQEWAHLATSGTIWLVLPLVFGIWRLLRSEVK
jgi:ABC-type transport system involved in multi-copper enzyme maturation permease subunit